MSGNAAAGKPRKKLTARKRSAPSSSLLWAWSKGASNEKSIPQLGAHRQTKKTSAANLRSDGASSPDLCRARPLPRSIPISPGGCRCMRARASSSGTELSAAGPTSQSGQRPFYPVLTPATTTADRRRSILSALSPCQSRGKSNRVRWPARVLRRLLPESEKRTGKARGETRPRGRGFLVLGSLLDTSE